MIYREKDIEKLEHMPKTWTSRRAYGWDQRRDWHYNWYAMHSYLHTVNPAALIGKSLEYITKRYLHRLPPVCRSIKHLLDIIGIQYKEELRYGWWRRHIQYLLEDNMVILNPHY